MGHGVKSEVRGENTLILLLKQKEIPIADYNFYHYPGNPLAHVQFRKIEAFCQVNSLYIYDG